MSGVYGLCAFALSGAFLVLVLRQTHTAYALAVSLLLSVYLLWRSVSLLQTYAARWQALAAFVPSLPYQPLLRVAGMGVLIQLTADLCEEAGQPALKGKILLFGRMVITLCTLPLVTEILQILTTELL